MTGDALDGDAFGQGSRPGSFIGSNLGDPIDQGFAEEEEILVKDVDLEEVDAEIAQPDFASQVI